MLGLELTAAGIVQLVAIAWGTGAAIGVLFYVLSLLLPGEPPRDG